MLSLGFDACIKANWPLVNRLITWHFAGCLTMLQSDAASTITNLINWFSVFDFTKNIKQAGDEIFKCASLCKTLSLYGIILQSYCTNKKGAIFYASQCSVATYWKCGGVFNNQIRKGLLLSVKFFLKSVNTVFGKVTNKNVIVSCTCFVF